MTSGVLPVFSRFVACGLGVLAEHDRGDVSTPGLAGRFSHPSAALCASSAALIHDEPGPWTRSTWIGAGGRFWNAKPSTIARTVGNP